MNIRRVRCQKRNPVVKKCGKLSGFFVDVFFVRYCIVYVYKLFCTVYVIVHFTVYRFPSYSKYVNIYKFILVLTVDDEVALLYNNLEYLIF